MTRASEAIAWSIAIGLSGLASWGTLRGTQPTGNTDAPEALVRTHTADDIEELTQRARRVATEVGKASIILGRALTVQEIEGVLPNGQAVLSQPLPDNPLIPGVGRIRTQCPASHRCGDTDPADWCYCPESGDFIAVIPH